MNGTRIDFKNLNTMGLPDGDVAFDSRELPPVAMTPGLQNVTAGF